MQPPPPPPTPAPLLVFAAVGAALARVRSPRARAPPSRACAALARVRSPRRSCCLMLLLQRRLEFVHAKADIQ